MIEQLSRERVYVGVVIKVLRRHESGTVAAECQRSDLVGGGLIRSNEGGRLAQEPHERGEVTSGTPSL
jgi:hypothetical protein